jgi:gamma-glutamyltranspeptidase/glutathione hydrolase
MNSEKASMPSDQLPFNSRRSPVHATKGMVAASQPLAAAAGIEILRAGGNAADAAIATNAALNVTEPTSCGIGGDCFALFYDASTGKISALNGSGRAPRNLTLELLATEGFEQELPPLHAHTVTVPGTAAAWEDLSQQHGKLPLADALQPAIQLALEGFPVAPITSYFWTRGADKQLKEAPGGQELTLDGRAPQAGEVFRNPGLAKTLHVVADQGTEAFYVGEIAEAIAQVVQDAGGVLSPADLAEHSSSWVEPISTEYHGLQVWECPPNGQGLTALLALNILRGTPITEFEALSIERLHMMAEAFRLAFADARWFVADPEQSEIPLEQLLSEDYAEERRKLIDPKRAKATHVHGIPKVGSDTVYLTVVDGSGNACSLINSNYMGFGTGLVPKGWGFTLQNRGHGFSLDPAHPNALAPGKRPYHTIIPAMATREDGSLFGSFGVMGGFMQPQGHVQVVVAMQDDKLDPQAALDRPRVCLPDGSPDSGLAVEEGIPTEVASQLSAMGHEVEMVSGQSRAVFGRGQIILRSTDGVLIGGSDPRADGCAIALV